MDGVEEDPVPVAPEAAPEEIVTDAYSELPLAAPPHDEASSKTSPYKSSESCIRKAASYLGVQPEVFDSGWATIYKNPDVMFVGCVITNYITMITNTCVMVFGSMPFRLSHHLPTSMYAVLHFTTATMILLRGPAVAKTKIYYAILMPAIFLQFPVAVVLMLGPIEFVPFENRLVFALVNACAM